LLKELPKATKWDTQGNNYQSGTGATLTDSKTQSINDMGFKKRTAYRFKTLAEHVNGTYNPCSATGRLYASRRHEGWRDISNLDCTLKSEQKRAIRGGYSLSGDFWRKSFNEVSEIRQT
jgi:hypothetical protein